jgi:TRAP-type C4-dicarboxylate transport system permease small subunit
MAAYGQNRLDVYFTVYLIETLVLTEIYVYLTPKARKVLNLITGVLFIGFVGIVAFEVYRILSD